VEEEKKVEKPEIKSALKKKTYILNVN